MRIGIAKSSFTCMNKVLTSRNIDMAVLYGCEARTLSSVIMKKWKLLELAYTQKC